MFRPGALVPCEHVFSSLRTSAIAQRALGALDLARSFLLLEDDHDVDWEVDWDEPTVPVHAHRVPLRRRSDRRRPGTPAPAGNECLSPTFYGQPWRRWNAGATRESRQDAPDGVLSARRDQRAARTETRAVRLLRAPDARRLRTRDSRTTHR